MEKRTVWRAIFVISMLIVIIATQELLITLNYAIDTLSIDYYNNTTNNNDVTFSCKLNSDEQNINSDDLMLIVNIGLKRSGLFNGKISLENSNFKFKDKEQDGINKVTDKEVTLNPISEVNNYTYQIAIEPIKDSPYYLENLDRETNIRLEGTFELNSYSKANIMATKKVSLKLLNPYINPEEGGLDLNASILTNKIFEVDNENKKIIQLAVRSCATDNKYPVKESEIKLKIPELAQDIEVISRGTYATNGKDENNFDASSWNFDKETGILTIKIQNEEKDGYVSWNENAKDKFIINLTYGEDIDLASSTIQIEGRMLLYDNLQLSASQKIDNLSEEKEGIINYTSQILTNEIYKGKLYSQEETEVKNISSIDITYEKISKQINLKESLVNYNTTDENITLEAHGMYKSSTINKAQLINVLGDKGELILKDSNGNDIITINKETPEDENGNIIVTYESQKEILVQINNAENQGRIDIENTLYIKEDYNKEDIKLLKTVNLSGKLVAENVAQEQSKDIQAELLESTSRAKLKISNKNLSVEQINQSVNINTILYTNSEKYNLYKNPKIYILLPEEIEKIEVNQANIFYDNELNLDLENVTIETFENNRKVMQIVLNGEQTKHIEGDFTKGANIVVNCNMVVSKDINNTSGQFIMRYENEGEENYYEDAISKADVEYIIPEVKIDETKSANMNEQSERVIIQAADSVVTPSVEITKEISCGDGNDIYQRQVEEYTINVKNNGETTIDNLTIEDPIPEEMIYVEELFTKGYQNTFEEHNEITKVERRISNLKPGEVQTITYCVIPKKESTNIGRTVGTKATAKVGDYVFESNLLQNVIKENNLQVWLTLLNNREEKIFSQDSGATFIIKIKNLTNEKMENVKVKNYIPEGMSYLYSSYLDYDTERSLYIEDLDNTIENDGYNEEENLVTWDVPSLEANEEKALKVVLIMDKTESNEEIIEKSNKVSAEYNGIETESNIAKVRQYAGILLNVSLKSNLKDTYLYEGDEFEYTVTIANNGTISYTFSTLDELPEGLEGEYVTYKDGNGDEQIINIQNNVDVYLSIDSKESTDVKIKVQAKELEDGKDELEIRNYATASVPGLKYINSNELVNIIRKNPNKNNNEDEDEDNGNDSNNNNDNDSNDYNPADSNDYNNNTSNNSTDSTKHSISGLAWIDKNKDGSRNSGEEIVQDIEVRLIYADTGTYVKDTNGNILSSKTGQDGKYIFNNLNSGNYLVMFIYDNGKYSLTEYQKMGANSQLNSDAMKYELDDDGITIGLTDSINIENSNIENIDIGLIENQIFDLKLDKYVNKVTINDGKQTKIRDFKKSTLAKIELDRKTVNNTNIEIEYVIEVANEGEIVGYAKEIIDYIPQGLEFSQKANSGWEESNGSLIYTGLADVPISVGETKTIKLILTKKMNDSSLEAIINTAEISKDYNGNGIKDIDSAAGNKQNQEDDMGTANLIVGIKTGLVETYIISIFISIAIMGIGIFFIKKKVLDVDKT